MVAPQTELTDLIDALLDGRLDEPGQSRLGELLESSPEARAAYLHALAIHSELAARLEGSLAPAFPMPAGNTGSRADTLGSRPARQSAAFRWVMLAGLALMAGLSVYWLSGEQSPRGIAHAKEIKGAVFWDAGVGNLPTVLTSGARLSAGTLVVEGETASVQLLFDDGTRIVLNGDAELAFSDEGQKRLSLRRGVLNADVAPQPAGKPMIVRTPTAQMEVLGTVFALHSEGNETELHVESGRVQFRRLADGKSVTVHSRQSVAATLVATEMSPEQPRLPPTHWRQTFEVPPAVSECTWLPPLDDQPARLRAAPFVAGRRNDAPLLHHGVRAYAPAGARKELVTLTDRSIVRFRYRLEREVPLICFLNCQQPGGAFAGNFFVVLLPKSAEPPDAHGWRWATLPLVSAKACVPEKFPTAVGGLVRMLRVHSIEEDVGLEVCEIEISSPAETQTPGEQK